MIENKKREPDFPFSCFKPVKIFYNTKEVNNYYDYFFLKNKKPAQREL